VLTSLRHPQDQQSDNAFIADTLGRLWLAGVPVNWRGVYGDERRQRLTLPTYPFERQRYWVGAAPAKPNGTKAPERQEGSAKKSDIADWFYVPSWTQSPLTAPAANVSERKLLWLLFADAEGLGDALAQRLMEAGHDVVVARVGEHFTNPDARTYLVNPRLAEDYRTLLKHLGADNRLPDRIVHMWSVSPAEGVTFNAESFDQAQAKGFFSLLFLAQALAEYSKPLHLTVITSGVHDVTGSEVLQAEKATILGACKVIPQELPHVIVRSFDLAAPLPSDISLIDFLARELSAETNDLTVAYRGNTRWVQRFEAIRLEEATEETSRLREGGVYLITGGLGRIGLTLAEHLARTVHAKLVLVGRTELPGRDQWTAWLKRHGEQNQVSRVIRRVQAIEKLGAEVLIARADAADAAAMQGVVRQALNRWGDIHGVIHAAGNIALSTRVIQQTDAHTAQQHFQPKAHALYVLDSVLDTSTLDFCLLFSSLSAVLGGLGFIAYSAANQFMDAYARQANREQPGKWISVNWDGWWFQANAERGSGFGAELAQQAILPEEGVKAFRRALSVAPQVVVSTSDLQARLRQWVQLETLRAKEPATGKAASNLHPRPSLATSFVAPSSEVEQTIADMWEALLGIAQIGIHDNFFELGGNSLLAIQLLSRLREALHVDLSVQELFAAPTIAELAGSIQQRLQPIEDNLERIDEMLQFVEQLSDEELKALLEDREEP
jgi:acyl transferase domain-containing protein/aryl carrier-like protein